MAEMTLGKALNAGIRQAMRDDDKVVIMGEDIGKLGGVFRITDGLLDEFGAERVMDTPLAESGIVGMAVGLAFRGWSVERRFLAAFIIEAAWEIAENTPMVIDRYREATMALGYSGDSVLNSVSDVAMMALGFLLARKLPVWASVAVVLALELAALWAVRDNLTLNVWMLLAPNDAILHWQAAGGGA